VYTPVNPKPGRVSALWYFWFLTWILLQTEDQDLPISLTTCLQSKRAIQAIPLLVTLGITAAMGTGAVGIGTSVYYYTKLSNQLLAAESILTLQRQLTLASVTLQNQRGLDLLMTEKGGLCLFLQGECCLYVNHSGVVKNKTRQLQDQLEKWRRELEDSWNPLGNNISQWFFWLMPILMPMFLALIFLSFIPCIIRTVQRFLLACMSAIANQNFNQLNLQGYQPLQNCLEKLL
jgi:hypothetical protein